MMFRKIQELKERKDEPQMPVRSLESISEHTPSPLTAEATRKRQERSPSPNADARKKQHSPPPVSDRATKTKASQNDKAKERQKQGNNDESKKNQREIASGVRSKSKEGSIGKDRLKGRKRSSVRDLGVKWKNTSAAAKRMTQLTEAVELERRLKAHETELSPETNISSAKIGSASDALSRENQINPAADKSKMLQKKAEPSETDKTPKGQLEFDTKAGDKRIPSSKENLDTPELGENSDKIPKVDVTDGQSEKQKVTSKSAASTMERIKKGFLTAADTGQEASPNVSGRRKSSTIALNSIEEEILNRVDPDLEDAIIRSMSFSFRIGDLDVKPEDLSAYIQKMREAEAIEEMAAEETEVPPQKGPVRRESTISALTAESGVTKEEVPRKRQGWRVRLLERVDDALSASVKSKHCMEIFRCVADIEKEKRRQRKVNRFIIHPYSEFRIGWDIMVVIALILTMIALPVEIAFFSVVEEGEHEGESLPATHAPDAVQLNETSTAAHLEVHGFTHEGHIYEGINLFAEGIFILDIILNFRTGFVFRELDQVVLSNKAIAWNYIRTWFFFDFISAVPFDKLYEWTAGPQEDRTQYLQIRFIRLAKILALLRAFQVLRLLRYIRTLQTIFLMQENIVEIFNLISVTLLLAHWNGCLQFMACFTEYYPHFPPDSWIAVDNLQWNNVTVLRRYTRSVVRALSHMLAVGYGQSPPTATSETWIVLISMLVGCTFYALFIAYMAALVRSLDYSGAQFNEEVDSLREFMRSRKIPGRTQRRIFRFLDQKYRHKFFDSDVYFKTSILSPSVQESLSMHNCRRMVESVSFFSNASKEFIYEIVRRLEFQVFYPGDIIAHAGAKTQCLLLVAHGKVEVYSDGILLEKIYDGGYYGEVSLLLNTPQEFDIIAGDVSDIYQLTKAGFDEVLSQFSEIRDSLRKIGAVLQQRRSSRIKLRRQNGFDESL